MDLSQILGGSTGTWNIPGTNITLPDYQVTESAAGVGIVPKDSTWVNPIFTNAPTGSGIVNTPVTGAGTSPIPNRVPLTTTPTGSPAPSGGGSGDVGYAPTFDGQTVSINGKTYRSSGGVWQEVGGGSGSPDVLNGINAAWGNYENQLNSMLNTDLPNQQTAQNTMAQNAFNQGVNTLDSQKAQSSAELTNQQNKNLKDLGSNVRNLFQSGNQYLGSRGAGDSTAANQYAYAIGKMGTQARGDIMSQVSTQMSNIGNIYNSEKNRLQSELTNKVAEISQWFSSAQTQLRQQLAQAGISKSQDIQNYSQQLVNQALTQLQYAQQQVDARRGTLETWAANNSTNVQQMAQKMQELQSIPQFQGLFPNTSTSGGGGAVATLFGNAGKKTEEYK